MYKIKKVNGKWRIYDWLGCDISRSDGASFWCLIQAIRYCNQNGWEYMVCVR